MISPSSTIAVNSAGNSSACAYTRASGPTGPLIDALRRQLGAFRRHQTIEETNAALAAERTLALEDDQLTEPEKIAWVSAVDQLAAEWDEQARKAIESEGFGR